MKKKIIAWAEHLFTLLSLVMYTGAFFPLVASGGFSEGDGGNDVFSNYALGNQIFTVIYFITIFLLACRWRKVASVILKNKYILIFTLFAIASTGWSVFPDKTLSRSLSLLGTILFSLYLTTQHTIKAQLILLVQTFTLILIASVVTIVLFPQYGVMGGIHAGAWRGIYIHKNVFGQFMVMSISIFFLQSTGYNKHQFLIYAGLGLSMLLLLMTRSSSAIVNLLTILSSFLVFRTWKWRYEMMIPASIAIVFVSIIFYYWFDENSTVLFAGLNKTANLSGRTEIWSILPEIALRRPWFGYGFDIFWTGLDAPSGEVWYAVGWNAPNAHNGFFDLWLGLGIVGLFLLSLSFMDTIVKGYIWLRYFSKTPDGFWPLIFMVFFVISNLTESKLMRQNDFFTVVYVAISYSLTTGMATKNHPLAVPK
jgi:exopolysaccharide production protein ExoQ